MGFLGDLGFKVSGESFRPIFGATRLGAGSTAFRFRVSGLGF